MQVSFSIQKSISVIHHISRLKKKNHVILLVVGEKVFDKLRHSFVVKNFHQSKNGGELPYVDKEHLPRNLILSF